MLVVRGGPQRARKGSTKFPGKGSDSVRVYAQLRLLGSSIIFEADAIGTGTTVTPSLCNKC